MNSNFKTFIQKIKELIIIYFIKKQIIINFFLYFIKRINLGTAIGTELLKNDFYKELNENIFFSTRSLMYELGNFTKKKNILTKKLAV